MALRALLRGATAEQLTYRFDTLSNLLLTVAYYGIQLLFFDRVFDLSPTLGGWTREEVYLVFFIFIVIMLSVEMISYSVDRFFYFIHLGTAEPLLIKPCGVVPMMLLCWSQPSFGAAAALLVVSVLVLGAANIVDLGAMANLRHESLSAANVWKLGPLSLYLGFGIGIIAGWIASLSLAILLNTITFVIQRQIPVGFIHGELLRLSIFAGGPISKGHVYLAYARHPHGIRRIGTRRLLKKQYAGTGVVGGQQSRSVDADLLGVPYRIKEIRRFGRMMRGVISAKLQVAFVGLDPNR